MSNITDEQFKTLVEKDVKNRLNENDREVLLDNAEKWKDTLIHLKRETETQFTAQKARNTANFKLKLDGDLTQEQYLDRCTDANYWKVSARRFIISAEERLSEARYKIGNSTDSYTFRTKETTTETQATS